MNVFQAELDPFAIGEGEELNPLHGTCFWVDEEGKAVLLEGREVLKDDDLLHGAQFQGFGGDEALLVEGGGGLREGGREGGKKGVYRWGGARG